MVLSLANKLDGSSFESRAVSFTSDCTSFKVFGPPTVPHHLIDVKSAPFAVASRVRDYARLLNEVQPDLVHAHMFHSLLLTVLARAMSSVKPAIVFTSHNTEIARGRREFIWATRAMRSADVIFFQEQHPELNSPRTVVIPNGIDVSATCLARTAPTAGRPAKFLFVGRLAEAKDPLGLVRSFANAQLPNAHLYIAGTGPLEPQLRAAVLTMNMVDRVNLLGLRSDTRELMRRADALVLHSRHEGLPLVVLEAGAEALPVLSTPIGGVPGILKEGAGFLSDVTNFSRTLREVAEAPDVAIARGRKLYQRVSQSYSTPAMVHAHEQLYGSVVAGRGD